MFELYSPQLGLFVSVLISFIFLFDSGHKCHKCDLMTNLWMNLSDGTISCGRRFWDGSGGNNHAIEHYERTKYPLAVKLGTITPTVSTLMR